MEVIPAIDIRGGKCVRLFKGDFSRETVFSPDPVEVSRRFFAQGAKKLHIIDLDGAERGRPQNLPALERIARAFPLPVQFGGGLRRIDDVERVLGLGVERAILGTSAVEEPDLVARACQLFPGRIVVSLDARRGYVATHGWQKRTKVKASQLLEEMAALGVGRFIYTDIERDGTLTRPNFTAIKELLSTTRLPVVASGGISRLQHLARLQALGVEGAVIGRALYTGDIDLKQALGLFNATEPSASASR
jgi:phosphoribosylformimino-5-aminoimidazole carboxamide ribotide isomerase